MWLLILAQETVPESGDLLNLIARSYGVAAPAILGLGFMAWTFWKRLTSTQDNLVKLLEAQVHQVVPVMRDATHRLNENSEAMEKVAVMMHQLAGRPGIDPDLWRRVLNAIEAAEKAR